MAAIRVPQLARVIVVLGKEEGGVIPLCRVFEEQLIHRLQKSFGLFPSRCALAPQSGLEIRHQQSRSHAFARYVCDHETEPSVTEIKEVVVVSSDGPSWVETTTTSLISVTEGSV